MYDEEALLLELLVYAGVVLLPVLLDEVVPVGLLYDVADLP